MTHRNLRSLDAEGARVREALERAGFDVTATPFHQGAWGRIDLAVSHPHHAGTGKVQVHCNSKGVLSVVPQGPLAPALAGAIGCDAPAGQSRPAAAPRASRASRASHAGKTGASSVPDGTLVVDCSKTGDGLIGPTEWRGMMRRSGAWAEAFHSPLYERGHNNVGEFLALVDALRRIEADGLAATALYSDSRTALAWLRKGAIKSRFDPAADFDRAFARALADALAWREALGGRALRVEPRLWPTAQWGDIPADFGRK